MKKRTNFGYPRYAILFTATVLLSACGGGTGSSVVAATAAIETNPSYTVSGTVTGLAQGKKFALVNNGADTLAINTNGNFTFDLPVDQGASYTVLVNTQPDGQICTASSNYSPSINANVNDVMVVCSDQAVQVSVAVSGLPSGEQLSVVDNMDSAHALTMTSNGTYAFSEIVAAGSPTTITVADKPVTEACTIAESVATHSNPLCKLFQLRCVPSTFATIGSYSATGPRISGSVISDAAGNLYGVNSTYGGNGMVIKMSSTGEVKVLYQFKGGVDGSAPNDGLVMHNDGNLYGTTRMGGANDYGTVFKIAAPSPLWHHHSRWR